MTKISEDDCKFAEAIEEAAINYAVMADGSNPDWLRAVKVARALRDAELVAMTEWGENGCFEELARCIADERYGAGAYAGMSAVRREDLIREARAACRVLDPHIAALQAKIEAAEKERDRLREALTDMYAGWKYIRANYGDLYGVGWDRCDEKARAALGGDK